MTRFIIASVLFLVMLTRVASAQNPVQWNGNVKQAVDRAEAQSLPLLFWVTGNRDDDDDLADAQSECFRDPVVVEIVHRHFVPIRVSRNSNVLQEAERLGLPTTHGLFCAVITTDGRLLAQMGPGEVANPAAFTTALTAAYDTYCNELLQNRIMPVLVDPRTPKAQVRQAAQTVWRLGIRQADTAIIILLSRKDLTPGETSRLYGLLAALSTEVSITALLDRSEDKAAAAALMKAEPLALGWLLRELPGEEGIVSPRQIAAYNAAVGACRSSVSKDKAWWEKATPEQRRKELEWIKNRAENVLDYWQQSQGMAK